MKLLFFVVLAPLVFLGLAACDFSGAVAVEITIPCIGPPPIIDSLAGGEYNGACPYRMWWNDTLVLVQPGLVK